MNTDTGELERIKLDLEEMEAAVRAGRPAEPERISETVPAPVRVIFNTDTDGKGRQKAKPEPDLGIQ